MSDLDFSYEELDLSRELCNGSLIYKDQNNNIFNEKGKRLNTVKFETLFLETNKQQTKTQGKEEPFKKEKEKLKKEEKKKKEEKEKKEESMSQTQTVALAYDYTTGIVDILLEKFDGKELGSEELTKEIIMKELFGEYKPGDKVKKEKKVKKARPLTGYTYFGQQNKVKFNEEMEKLDEKPKYVAYLGKEWAKLSKDEKEEWDKKAKEAFEESKSE